MGGLKVVLLTRREFVSFSQGYQKRGYRIEVLSYNAAIEWKKRWWWWELETLFLINLPRELIPKKKIPVTTLILQMNDLFGPPCFGKRFGLLFNKIYNVMVDPSLGSP